MILIAKVSLSAVSSLTTLRAVNFTDLPFVSG